MNVSFAPSLSAIPTSTPEISTVWKTYSDRKYSYEIKYPSGWTLSNFEDGSISIGGEEGGITIDPTNKVNITLPIKSWIEKSNKELLSNPNRHPASSPYLIVSYENELQIKETPVAIDNSFFVNGGKSYIFNHNETIFFISAAYYYEDKSTEPNKMTSEISKAHARLVNQILSTFKFTD